MALADLDRGHLRGQRGGAGLVGLLGDDGAGRQLVLDALQAALAEVVVLVEHADLGVGEVLLEVLAEDLALDRVVGLPAERLGLGGAVVPARAAGGHEHVGHLGGVEVTDDLGVRRRAETLEDAEHLVLQHELVHHVDGVGGVVGVVLDDQVDLAPEHAAVGVDVVEERLGGGSDLAVARRRRPRQRLMGAERDTGAGDPGALELPPLLDDPQPTAATATPAVTAAAISRRRLTAPISLLLHLWVTFRRRP